MSELSKRLRETRANMLGTDDEQHYNDCQSAADALDAQEAALRQARGAISLYLAIVNALKHQKTDEVSMQMLSALAAIDAVMEESVNDELELAELEKRLRSPIPSVYDAKDAADAIRDLRAQLAEANARADEAFDKLGAEIVAMREDLDAAIERAEKAEAARDNWKAHAVSRGKRLSRTRDKFICIADELEDEGDRVFFGSSNHADEFKAEVAWLDAFKWAKIMGEPENWDLLGTLDRRTAERDAAIARAEKAEAERDRLRECNYELQNVTEQICIEKITKDRDAARAEARELRDALTAIKIACDAPDSSYWADRLIAVVKECLTRIDAVLKQGDE